MVRRRRRARRLAAGDDVRARSFDGWNGEHIPETILADRLGMTLAEFRDRDRFTYREIEAMTGLARSSIEAYENRALAKLRRLAAEWRPEGDR